MFQVVEAVKTVEAMEGVMVQMKMTILKVVGVIAVCDAVQNL